MPLTYPYDLAIQAAATGPEIQANFAAAQNKFNAGITGADIAASPGLAVSQLPVSIEHLSIPLIVHPIAAGWPAAGVMAVHTLPDIAGAGIVAWVATAVSWSCADTGGGTGQFRVVWGEYDAAGAWSTILNVGNATVIAALAGAGNDGNVVMGGGNVTLTLGAAPRSLALTALVADAATLALGNAWDTLTVTVRLQRQITAT